MEFVFDTKDYSTMPLSDLNGLNFVQWRDLLSQSLRLPAHESQWIRKIDDWLVQTIIRPHSQLGRKGAICPYVKKALLLDGIMAIAVRGAASSQRQWTDLVSRSRIAFQNFQAERNDAGLFCTLLIVTPDLEAIQADDLFLSTLAQLKTQFVSSGCMLGEFHQGPPEKGGLHNPNFRPLYSPVALMAVRQMVETDIHFLKGNDEWAGIHASKFCVPAE